MSFIYLLIVLFSSVHFKIGWFILWLLIDAIAITSQDDI
jgi:hypothetical protein